MVQKTLKYYSAWIKHSSLEELFSWWLLWRSIIWKDSVQPSTTQTPPSYSHLKEGWQCQKSSKMKNILSLSCEKMGSYGQHDLGVGHLGGWMITSDYYSPRWPLIPREWPCPPCSCLIQLFEIVGFPLWIFYCPGRLSDFPLSPLNSISLI